MFPGSLHRTLVRPNLTRQYARRLAKARSGTPIPTQWNGSIESGFPTTALMIVTDAARNETRDRRTQRDRERVAGQGP
jgi:hypothetical protein